MLVSYELTSDSDTSRAAVEADAEELYRITEEDRQLTCGDDYRLEPHPFRDLTVGGVAGHRFGYTLRDPQGAPTEIIVLHVAFDAGRQIVVSTAFSDPQGCPGEDPVRDELPTSAYPAVEPYLDQLAAESTLPTDFDGGPLCRPDQVPSAGFADTDGNPHRHLIDCLAWLGIAKGYSTTRYGVAEPVTRGQLATVLARLIEASGEPLPDPTDQGFTDLTSNPHARAINQLAQVQVVNGTSPTTFEPNRAVTRAQAAAMVVAAHEMILGHDMYDEGVTFDDVRGIHADSISRAATAHLVFGTDDGSFEPARQLRRDQMASLVGRAVNRLASGRGLTTPTAALLQRNG